MIKFRHLERCLMSPQRASQFHNILMVGALGLLSWILMTVTSMKTDIAVTKSDVAWLKELLPDRLAKK